MSTFILALAGASGSGKSTLAAAIREILGPDRCDVVSTSQVLRERYPALAGDRDALKKAGDDLDRTDPSWQLSGIIRESGLASMRDRWIIVDAVRSLAQLAALKRFGIVGLVSRGQVPEFDPDAFLGSHRRFPAGRFCDDPRTLALSAIEGTRWSSHGYDGVIGAQWGSEGKGKVCCALTRQHSYSAMARAGGPNAGHRVQLPGASDGLYSQDYAVLRHLPSATPYAREGSLIAIGPGAVVDLKVLACELRFVPRGVRLVVDPAAVIVTERAHMLEKSANVADIGSTCTGTGGAQALRALRDTVTFGHLATNDGFRQVVEQTRDVESAARVRAAVSVKPVGRALREAATRGRVLFEGTQGMGLSVYHGRYPYVTSRDVSPSGLLSELGLPPDLFVTWHYVARTYPIRVGGPSGPLPGETDWDEVARTSGREPDDLRGKERTSVTNRLRRVARWQRGSLFEAVQRGTGARQQFASVWITFADYLRDDQAKLTEIIEEARACADDVYLGTGPGTVDWERA